MTTYLLLRSNKESGPFSLDELVQFGLKPYDLVWVTGKSAAWRYPSEVTELKPYAAPGIEEQPFDRFYKKNTEVKKVDEAPVNVVVRAVRAQEPVVEPISEPVNPYQPQLTKEEISAYIPKKSVFVTLPGQRPAAAAARSVVKEPVPVIEKYVPPVIPAAIPQFAEEPVASKVKYSQPLDEIKEMYVKTLQDRKSKIIRKNFMSANLRRAAAVAGLIGIGVLAGFIIKPKSGKNVSLTQQAVPANTPLTGNTTTTTPQEATLIPEETQAVMPAITDEKTITREEKAIAAIKNQERTPVLKAPVSETPNTSTSKIKKEPARMTEQDEQTEEKYSYSATEKNPVTGERSRTVRNNNDAGKMNEPVEKSAAKFSHKATWEDNVFVSSNDYKKVAFGGIRDLRLTVTNNSKYELDNVIVELQYLKPSEQPLRTENIQFRGIAANESSTIKVPDTNRGIKVTYRILSIGSKQGREDMAGK